LLLSRSVAPLWCCVLSRQFSIDRLPFGASTLATRCNRNRNTPDPCLKHWTNFTIIEPGSGAARHAMAWRGVSRRGMADG
jgi:hypothetical protein